MDPVAAAKAYVREKLDVDFVQDKSDLLNKIIRAFFEKVPFQNISASILPPEDRFPTEQIVVESGTSLKGGLNVHNNWFFKILIEALGYKVEFLPACIRNPPSPKPRELGSHFAILVKDLNKPGDLHLVDVGCGYPVFKAVPLNQLPYTATDVTLTYRFIDEDGQWHSEHKDREGETWTRFVSYDKKSASGNPGEIFKGPALKFLNEDWLAGGITAVYYPQPGSPAIPDIPDFNKNFDYVIAFHNDEITFNNGSGFTWKESVPQNLTVRTFQDYFPNIPTSDVEKKLQILAQQAEQLRY